MASALTVREQRVFDKGRNEGKKIVRSQQKDEDDKLEKANQDRTRSLAFAGGTTGGTALAILVDHKLGKGRKQATLGKSLPTNLVSGAIVGMGAILAEAGGVKNPYISGLGGTGLGQFNAGLYRYGMDRLDEKARREAEEQGDE